MIYDIRLLLTHSYAQSADVGRHRLRVVPIAIPGFQSVTSWSLTGDPTPSERRDSLDFFGNTNSFVAHDIQHNAMQIEMKARVERKPQMPAADLSSALRDLQQDICRVSDLKPASPHHFLGPSPRIQTSAEVTEYAHGVTKSAETTKSAAWQMCEALHRDLQFDGTATTVDTPLEIAFTQKRGVCQDFAHIMIAGLRGIGIPARYVSGYLRTHPPEGQVRLQGADAMHAWVSVWCGGNLGWVELDPTNGIEVNTDHIVVGYGRDYTDVSPIKGMLRSTGQASVSQAVDVISIES